MVVKKIDGGKWEIEGKQCFVFSLMSIKQSKQYYAPDDSRVWSWHFLIILLPIALPTCLVAFEPVYPIRGKITFTKVFQLINNIPEKCETDLPKWML